MQTHTHTHTPNKLCTVLVVHVHVPGKTVFYLLGCIQLPPHPTSLPCQLQGNAEAISQIFSPKDACIKIS